MKKIKALAVAAGLTILASNGFAQGDEEAPDVFTYATYFTCPGGPLSRVDELIAEGADDMDALVEDGTILRWGWLKHHTGGSWNRAAYHQANSIEGLLDALDAMGAGNDEADEEAEEAAEDDGMAFGAVCNKHEDYIWQVEGGKMESRGAAGFSVYYMCDVARETRADEIFAETMAPILDKLVDDGELSSWGWSSHVVGGKYRKLQTMTAADHKSLLKARGKAIEQMYAEGSEAGEEFADICGPHVDYMWDIDYED